MTQEHDLLLVWKMKLGGQREMPLTSAESQKESDAYLEGNPQIVKKV